MRPVPPWPCRRPRTGQAGSCACRAGRSVTECLATEGRPDEASEDVADGGHDAGSAAAKFGLGAEAFHRLQIPVKVTALLQVDGAGEVFEVDHVGQVRLGEAQDGKGAGFGSVSGPS